MQPLLRFLAYLSLTSCGTIFLKQVTKNYFQLHRYPVASAMGRERRSETKRNDEENLFSANENELTNLHPKNPFPWLLSASEAPEVLPDKAQRAPGFR